MRTEIRIVGRIVGLTVYEARYTLPAEHAPYARSIFVKSASEQYREILLEEGQSHWTFEPIRLFFADGTALLDESYKDGSLIGGLGRTFVLTPDGAWVLDFSAADAKALVALPRDKEAYLSRVDFGTMTYYRSTVPKARNFGMKVSCCDGEMAVSFRIVNGRVVPGAARFSPIVPVY